MQRWDSAHELKRYIGLHITNTFLGIFEVCATAALPGIGDHVVLLELIEDPTVSCPLVWSS